MGKGRAEVNVRARGPGTGANGGARRVAAAAGSSKGRERMVQGMWAMVGPGRALESSQGGVRVEGGCQGLGGLVINGVQFGKVERSWRWMAETVAHHCGVLSAAERCS